MDGDFGGNLREARLACGLSQDELAARLGAGSGKHIWQYERGLRDPRLSTVRRLAVALECPVTRLVEDE